MQPAEGSTEVPAAPQPPVAGEERTTLVPAEEPLPLQHLQRARQQSGLAAQRLAGSAAAEQPGVGNKPLHGGGSPGSNGGAAPKSQLGSSGALLFTMASELRASCNHTLRRL